MVELALCYGERGGEGYGMTAEQFKREKLYQTALPLAKSMLARGLITPDEYSSIDTKLREKYAPSLGSLYPVQVP